MPQDTHGEGIATLEAAEKDIRQDIIEIKGDLKAILKTLNEMSGGKKALLGLFAIIGGIVGIVGTLLTIRVS